MGWGLIMWMEFATAEAYRIELRCWQSFCCWFERIRLGARPEKCHCLTLTNAYLLLLKHCTIAPVSDAAHTIDRTSCGISLDHLHQTNHKVQPSATGGTPSQLEWPMDTSMQNIHSGFVLVWFPLHPKRGNNVKTFTSNKLWDNERTLTSTTLSLP